ncbi:uncharacterized protein [Prorops nasuta]|uniref:uncharacterized protein n=1 Tax=Prorops nasuta TaxID=863751 RepID=UPI0034CE022F
MSSASTGGTEGSSPASSPASAASLTMAAPKYGTLVPNRIFVGGISASTSEQELAQLFSAYGNVKATKIISDRAGVSKGYGFVTFETEEEAKRLQQESECIVLRERKLNIAPAIKKQPFNRSFDGGSGSPPSVPTSTYYYTNGMGLAYQNGMTFYNAGGPAPGTAIAPPTDPATIYQAAGVFGPQAATGHQAFAPMMYPCAAPSLYMPQQYQYSPMPYEPYYAGAAAAGTPQYLYTASSTQSNTSGGGGGNNSGNGNSGTGGTSTATGPPPSLPTLPPPPAHFYAPAAPPPHHHPPVPAGHPPPQMDHLYYSFTAGPHHPPPPHAPLGITDQQLLLYATEQPCQQASTNDNQTTLQEDTRSTSSHSEQLHGEVQGASGSTTPLVSILPVKFPMSGRYATNYHPIAIHAANFHNSHTCLNDTEDCSLNQMHRPVVYHPVFLPHSHTTTFHNASGGSSLLPTPQSPKTHESNVKSSSVGSRDYPKPVNTNLQCGYPKSLNHGISLIQQNTFPKSQNLGAQLHKQYSNLDACQKYPNIQNSSRLPAQYNNRRLANNVGSPACFVTQKPSGYSSGQNLHKSGNSASNSSINTYGNSQKSGNYEYANGRKNSTYNADHSDNSNNNARSTNFNKKHTPCNYNKVAVLASNTNYDNSNSNNTSTEYKPSVNGNIESGNSDNKPASPPPAPYSPMTQTLPTISPPAPQVQFYTPTQNRYQSTIAQSQQQQPSHQQQQSVQRRYSVTPSLNSNRKASSTEKYSNGNPQTGILRQSKYKVNGIMQPTTKIPEDSLGGAGDAAPRLPITPPGTPRAHSGHPGGDQNQLNETCHQMQALSL